MKKYELTTFTTLIILLMAIAIAPLPAEAAPPVVTLSLTMSPTAVSFPDQDPDLFPTSIQNGGAIRITVNTTGVKGGQSWTVTAVSRGNLMAGPAFIPISAITWTAVKIQGDANANFYNGAMTTAAGGVIVARGLGSDSGKSLAVGDYTFSIANSWIYATGNYNQITDFTLTSP